MFSASLAPPNAKAATAALHVIQKETWRHQKLWANTRLLLQQLQEKETPIGRTETPIIPVFCGENQKAFCLARELYEHGYLATAVIYPAVPAHMSRLRLCVTAAMDDALLHRFAQDLDRCLVSMQSP